MSGTDAPRRFKPIVAGPGTHYTSMCTSMPFFAGAAIHACIIIHLHVFLSVTPKKPQTLFCPRASPFGEARILNDSEILQSRIPGHCAHHLLRLNHTPSARIKTNATPLKPLHPSAFNPKIIPQSTLPSLYIKPGCSPLLSPTPPDFAMGLISTNFLLIFFIENDCGQGTGLKFTSLMNRILHS